MLGLHAGPEQLRVRRLRRRLPQRSMVDIQYSTEYVVHAIDTVYAATGRNVDVIGCSRAGR
ncbi:hypothetical protein GCM10009759_76480 [Kitasatospora saccharophila]|uniref:Alpha/beta hydrolase family protein n=1 Tax=Kitasatospora saccharophila TaxID=407973 RepID=A0ABP5JYS9_9ACTN